MRQRLRGATGLDDRQRASIVITEVVRLATEPSESVRADARGVLAALIAEGSLNDEDRRLAQTVLDH